MLFGNKNNNTPIETLIGEQCSINGNISGTGKIKIDGNIDGNIIWDDDIIIEICSTCTGNISCKSAAIFGKINGDIVCESTLTIETMGKVNGNISCANLIIKEGAFISGKCTMITQNNSQDLSDS